MIAVDLSTRTVEVARKRSKQYPNIVYIVADAAWWELPSARHLVGALAVPASKLVGRAVYELPRIPVMRSSRTVWGSRDLYDRSQVAGRAFADSSVFGIMGSGIG